jgi:hypothetical protein
MPPAQGCKRDVGWQDRDETETFVSRDRDETETFEKTSRDVLATRPRRRRYVEEKRLETPDTKPFQPRDRDIHDSVEVFGIFNAL